MPSLSRLPAGMVYSKPPRHLTSIRHDAPAPSTRAGCDRQNGLVRRQKAAVRPACNRTTTVGPNAADSVDSVT